jgi:hypothetical protein
LSKGQGDSGTKDKEEYDFPAAMFDFQCFSQFILLLFTSSLVFLAGLLDHFFQARKAKVGSLYQCPVESSHQLVSLPA